MDKLSAKLSIITSIITLVSIIGSIGFWFYKTNELPKRVENTEERITEAENRISLLETQLTKNDTKTDLLLQAVYEIRSALLKK